MYGEKLQKIEVMAGYKKIILLAVIFAVSGLYCALFFNGYLGLSDGNDYAGLARSVIRGEGFQLGHLYPLAFAFSDNIPQPNNMWAPGYPVFLAAWFMILGMSDTAVLVATIFSIWLLIFAVYMLAGRLVGEKWALLAAALTGLSQTMLATALEGSPEPLTAALLVLSVYTMLSNKNRTGIILSGVFFGLAVLTRYQLIVLALPLLLFLSDRKLKSLVSWLGILFLILAPWLVRNYVVFGNPLFTLQTYGEFTKGMGHLNYYYYTYRSFTPMSFSYALSHFPFYVFKKFAAGILFFSWWTMVVLNFFGAVPFVLSLIRIRHFENVQKRFLWFGLTSLLLLIVVSSLDGIHLRHLVNIQGILVVMLVMGFIQLIQPGGLFKKRYLKVAAMVLLLLPLRFPYLEIELISNAHRIERDKEAYDNIKEQTEIGSVIVSDASDAVWWYTDRYSIWIPVLYEDLKTLKENNKADYIYLEKTTDYLGKLDDSDLLDFLDSTSIVSDIPPDRGLFRVEKADGGHVEEK